ncbi:unnamed protein product [Paramecium primaurelia]|uniref:Cyclic nucleotide-binding domain-containing protein n=1 Tax=Paramecium primaurelia TaxID=5886 RepID=A0A8S1JSI9_PARPR|nr:unnamed protein product [Paramecium primaurelia]
MSDSIDQCNQQSCFQEENFHGPNPIMVSERILLGDGDLYQKSPDSNSFTVRDQSKIQDFSKDLVDAVPMDMHKSYKGLKKSEYQSAYAIEEELETGGKPQFLKLIISKSLQNNFINNLWNRSYLRKLHQLTPFQIQALDDLQFENEVYPEEESIKKEIKICEFIKKFFLQLEVFTPYSKLIFIWDLFQIFTYVLIFFWLPYKISFQLDYIGQLLNQKSKNQMIEIILLTILSFDVVIGLNLAFIYKGIIIKDRKRIIINYFKQYAFVDLVSISTVTIQFFILNDSQEDHDIDNNLTLQILFCVIFYVLRMTKINKILAQIQEFFNLNGSLNDLVGLLKLTMIILFIAHICACVWHGVAFYNDSYSWLDAYNLRDQGNASKYNTAIYWATMTMTTVGYGDITAKNNSELLINNLTMFIASIVFAYSVNSIGIFVSNMYKGTMEYSRSVTLINTFMSKNKIQFELQTRIRSYLEYIWQEEQNMNDDEVSQIICKLSSHLQDELQFQLRGNILRNCKVMVKIFSEKMIKCLLGQMEEQSFSPEERIITINQIDDGCLYVITKGEIELIFEGMNNLNERVKRNSLKYLSQGDFFGELSFFTGEPRKCTAISRGFTKVFKIKRENFLKVLSSFPNDYEKFCEVKHQLKQGDFSSLQIQCYSCQSNSHLIDSCNYLHFCADKEAILKKELYPYNQSRSGLVIRNAKAFKYKWSQYKYIIQRAKDFQTDFYQQPTDNENEENEQPSQMVNDNYTYEDESKIEIDVPSTLNQRSNSRTLSRVSQKPNQIAVEEDDDSKLYTRKVVNPRGTVQTAGFGSASLRESKKFDLTKDYEIEQPISEESSSEEKDQIIIPSVSKSQDRTQKQKITFIRKESSEDIVPRQASLRSRTFTQNKLQQEILKRSATPDKLTSEIEISTNNNNNIKRQAGKKHSTTKTYTKQVQEATEGNQNMTSVMDNQTYLPTIPQIFSQFDKMQIFTHFFPFSNYDIVIKRYARIQKFFGKKRQYPESSKYSFYFMTIKKGWKLKRLGEKLQGLKLVDTIRKPFVKTIQGTKIIKTKNILNTLGNFGQVSPQLKDGQERKDGIL